MSTNRGTVRKVNGATVSISLTKRAKKADNHRQISATPVQDMNLMTEEEEAAPSQDEVLQKLEAMMWMLVDLSSRVQAMEDQQREGAVSPTVSSSTSHPIRRTRHQLSPTLELDLSEEVITSRQMVTKRMRQLPIFTGPTTDEDVTSDKVPLERWHQQPLRSRRQCTGASMVENKVTWPHQVMHFMESKPAAYEDLSISLFIKGYLIVMKWEEGAVKDKMAANLEELMADLDLYGWQNVRAYHSVWPSQTWLGVM